jgi:hypothetical protein
MISPLAGKPAPKEMLIDIERLEKVLRTPSDVGDPSQLVAFGTSGHRGSPLHGTLTEAHILRLLASGVYLYTSYLVQALGSGEAARQTSSADPERLVAGRRGEEDNARASSTHQGRFRLSWSARSLNNG